MQGITPYISFKGNCEEAINFYKDKLGAEILFLGRYGDSPMADRRSSSCRTVRPSRCQCRKHFGPSGLGCSPTSSASIGCSIATSHMIKVTR